MPVCCGAIGEFDPTAVARIASNLDPEPPEVHRDARSTLFAGRPASRWDGEGVWGLAWGEREPDSSDRARCWEDAASAGALGLWARGELRGVHASASGVAQVYWMRSRGAVYFSTRVDALARAGLGTLSVDWQAWASILTLSYAQEGRTPFAEIRRLPARGAISIGDGPPVFADGGFAWLDHELLTLDDAAEQAAAGLRSEVAALEPQGPITCLLTGGWDSRLIASALAERGLIANAFTVGMDQGNAHEEQLAAAIAAELGVPHTVVRPEFPPFATELEQAAERVEYRSMLHLILHRLEGELSPGGICTDGFGGNLLKGRCLTPEILASDDPLDRTFDTLASATAAVVYEGGAWVAMRATAREGFLRENERFRAFRAPPTPALYNRTLYSIASAPMNIVGRRNRLFMPLVSDGVATAALAAPPADKGTQRFFRSVFSQFSPDLGRFPSTNDGAKPGRAWRPHLRKPEARAAHLALLGRSPLRPWFAPPLERLIERGRMAPLDGRDRRLRRVQAICMFGLWTERYSDLLGAVDPHEFLPPPASGERPSAVASR